MIYNLYLNGELVGSTDENNAIDANKEYRSNVIMTEQQAIEAIISEPKFYIGKMAQSTASNFIASYRKGMAKKKTINKFLETFGYVILTPETWTKQLEGKPSNLKVK